MACPLPPPFHVLADLHGEPLIEFSHYPADDLLYLRWHGHLTTEEVIRGAQLGRQQQQRTGLPYSRVLNDNRDASGDWHEALPWLQYEWLPQATAAGVRALGYVFSPDLAHQFVSQEFVSNVRPHLSIELFHDVDEAWQWLLTQ
ncbi:hypothetical protein [uncultured Hymenobacter sp.]|uniref:hypothetical protein n=1 Tax=uncultured Hymenobacter sp. TaxID=170016 RepID=UPI0035C95363